MLPPFFFSRVLKVEMETYKIRVKVLQEENRSLRQASVIIVSASSFVWLNFSDDIIAFFFFVASKSRTGRGIYLKYVAEEDPGTEEGEGIPRTSL